MVTIIAVAASCKVRGVIRFLHPEGQIAAEIHRRLCRVYGDNFMSDSCVRECCRKFRDGHTDMHDEVGQERHSIVTDELVQKVGGQERHSIVTDELAQKIRLILAWKTSFHDIRTF